MPSSGRFSLEMRDLSLQLEVDVATRPWSLLYETSLRTLFDNEQRRKPRLDLSRINRTMFKATILAALLASASAFAPTNFAGT